MSLKGLEEAEVIEAYQTALNEGGGWFLLKYNARDEVGLLERGKGGVGEIQEAVSTYEEESPLYGFIHYRRRNVVLKYVPEGTSRLLLARLAVHFESIKETFTPYDTIFTFAEAYELSDATLSSTCSLHTAASVKSLRNSPTQNLAGVKEEDVSESGTVRGPASEAGTIRNSKVEADVNENVHPTEDASSRRHHDDVVAASPMNGTSSPSKAHERVSSTATQGLRPRTASDTDKDLPPTPDYSSPFLSENPESVYDRGGFGPRSSIDTRISSNSARPSTQELNRAYDYNKAKVKVGPRPSIDSAMRPDTAHSSDHDVRPIASLPSGMRMSARRPVPPRPNSQQSQKRFPLQIPKIPSQGSAPAPPPVTPTNPTHPLDKRSLSHTNGLLSPAKNSEVTSPKMTPEKKRLMKALQIRQKHLAAQNAAKGISNDKPLENHEENKAEQEDLSSNTTATYSTNESQEIPSQQREPQSLNIETPEPEDREIARETSREIQDSPISVPEPSDGPSTQASSITEDENTTTQNQDISKTETVGDGYQHNPGLEDIIREQTEGPIVTIDADTHKPGEENVERPTSSAFASHENMSAPPSPIRQGQPSLAVGANNVRDSVKTTSISSTSSEHTMTDKKIPTPIDTVMSTERTPRPDAADEPYLGSNLIETSGDGPLPAVHSAASKQEPKDAPVLADAEEPESPFLIEGHSVQTSASPSVVNLLDGLAATTHIESAALARDTEVVGSTPDQQSSLFNMVGGFGGSGESLDTPLSAVREEAEIAPSPIQPKDQALDDRDLSQTSQIVLDSDADVHDQSEGLSQFPNVEDEPETTEEAQKNFSKGPDQNVESPPIESTADQKGRPRTTSKTFQFPSKSRNSDSKAQQSPLDLPRGSEHAQDSSDNGSSQNSYVSEPKPQSDTVPKEDQETQLNVQPEARIMEHSITQSAQMTTAKPDKQPCAQPAGVPVPEALSHASSKALRLLGFSADQPEAQPNVRTEQVAEPKIRTDVAPQVHHESRAVAATDTKSAAELNARLQEQLLPEGRSEGFFDANPDTTPEFQTQESAAKVFTSNPPKEIEEDKQTDRQARRRGVVEPIKRVSTPEPSDEQFLSDDSFMEELKTAKVQEAKPISVSRSPIKPGFLASDHDSKISESRDPRTVSNPVNTGSRVERSASSTRPSAPVSLRSFSGTILPRPDVKTPPGPQSAQPKKFGVSSGISQRIKALEVKSSRPNSPSLPAPTAPGFLNFRRPSFNSEFSGAQNRSRASTAYPSPQTSPEVGKSDPLNRSATSRGETVSVTAMIVRDPVDKLPWTIQDAVDPPTVNLHESPLIVEHQVAGPNKQQVMGPPQFSPLKPPRPRYSRYSSARSASSSSTEQKTDGTSHSRRGSSASKRSARSSRTGSEVDLPRALSNRSLNPSSQLDGIKEEKKGSRSSRLLKRMSSITSLSRRSIAQTISPSRRKGSILEREEAVVETPVFSVVDMGDINVQFPDTLLWKRRHMTINESGILELSASKADNSSKIATKRYPLSDFRPPYVPDQDRQELPNSIILDFNDGSSLQCACEHPSAQVQLLNTLKMAYSEHNPH